MHVKIEWTPAYSVKHPQIDDQHQHIFKLVDNIPDNLDSAKIKKCIMKLFKYTRTHFLDEEEIMRGINYPKLAKHQEQHDDLISHLSNFSDNNFQDQESLLKFKEFAYDWLVNHILEQDMKYYFFARENGVTW